jgi:shikimate kinase
MQKNNHNLYLLGFMGCGKTFLGQKLAKELGWSFCDLDDRIESIEKCPVSSIFENKGEDYFRKLEQKCLIETADDSNTVISLGGGTPCFNNNMEWINDKGCSVFLDVPTEILIKRLTEENSKRPLLQHKNKMELESYVNQKLLERRPFYSQADYSVTAFDLPVNKIINILCNMVK